LMVIEGKIGNIQRGKSLLRMGMTGGRRADQEPGFPLSRGTPLVPRKRGEVLIQKENLTYQRYTGGFGYRSWNLVSPKGGMWDPPRGS